MNRFSIRDIENLTGIKAHTLRIWEQRHGIIVPKRTDTNIRYYDGDDLKQALRIALLNQHGYKISRIQKMNEEEINTLLRETADTGFQFEYLLNNMIEATIDMDTRKFESLVDKYIRKFGLEQAVEQLFFAFLEKIGVMWMTNRLFPAQEHLVSNIIIRKILLAIEKQAAKPDFTQSTFLLFLPEGEIHEIGLLYIQYQLQKHDKHTIYLGANTPVDQVALVCKAVEPDYLYTHVTSASSDFDINSFLSRLSEVHNHKTIFVSGSMLQKTQITTSFPNVIFLSSLEEAKIAIYNL
ncbi:MAG: MerR family transcriptional regulator [Chitinophagaceae bacterium]|nr:MerR family transcriptional regulator [Chitinophagaceae bacterium]MCB9045352.1 MerR family transcriptional regulator [Chitinophagales bacterium]